MALSAGTRLGPYEILAPIGAGGMGEVYRAKDSKLDREVAIKILPDTLTHDSERLARFEREAKVLAALNHPNIAQIYAVEQSALVMELVPGEPPAGPLPLDTALNYAQQISDALATAHDRGITHRDLKPANIMVTPAGVIKLLDFGLAKAAEESATSENVGNSPTLTMSPTRAGMILGTAAYMAPEQARGKPVDRRADIWAFGVVLYEMLTGKQAFPGETVSDILASVLTKEPDLAPVPGKLRRLIASCLQKDPKLRLQAIGDWRLLVEAPLALPRLTRPWPWIAAVGALVIALIAVSIFAYQTTRPTQHPLIRLNVDLGPDAIAGANTTLAISPDGARIVFPSRGPDGRQRLATRLLDQSQATTLPGTENGSDPFFSPDGQWVGFFAGSQLKKAQVQGVSAPITICAAPIAQGGAWGEDGNIIAALSNLYPLSIVSAAGGTPQPFTKLERGEATHRWPQILPNNQGVLFTASATTIAAEGNIEVFSTKTKQRKTLVSGGYFGRYVPDGHLIYLRQGVLFGVGFDLEHLELRGMPTPLIDDVAANASQGVDSSISRKQEH